MEHLSTGTNRHIALFIHSLPELQSAVSLVSLLRIIPSSANSIYLDQEDDHILEILRQHQAYDFCHDYCWDDYNPQLVTVYTTKTQIETVRKTRTSTLKPSTTTKTVLGAYSLASTVTDTI